jgi:hypothetical protein
MALRRLLSGWLIAMAALARSVAQVLERASEDRSEPILDPVMAALAERYPGAPAPLAGARGRAHVSDGGRWRVSAVVEQRPERLAGGRAGRIDGACRDAGAGACAPPAGSGPPRDRRPDPGRAARAVDRDVASARCRAQATIKAGIRVFRSRAHVPTSGLRTASAGSWLSSAASSALAAVGQPPLAGGSPSRGGFVGDVDR